MHILCTNQALADRGGSESYLEVVTRELVQLGHRVTAWSPSLGVVAQHLEALGCTVTDDLDAIGPVDVVHAQHAPSALEARAAYPDTPLVFVCHSWALDVEQPPAAAAPAVVVALNDLVLRRLEASVLPADTTLRRLRQPVALYAGDTNRVPIRSRAQRAVAVSRKLSARRELLAQVCAEHGIRLEFVDDDHDPTAAMMSSDIVFTTGRGALEAMALGRAAFVFDEIGAEGFVTADTYPAHEARGFTPSGERPVTRATLAAELDRYDPSLGPTARELAALHHFARTHAIELVETYEAAIGAPLQAPSDGATLEQLAVLTRQVFELDQRVAAAEWHASELRRSNTDLIEELERLRSSTSWRITRPLRALRRRPDDHA